MIEIPFKCPRKRKDCIALSNIISDGEESFFCCGENDGSNLLVEQDKYRVCFKGEFDDRMANFDKRDVIHQISVLTYAMAVIEKDVDQDRDWSPWVDVT